LFVALSAVESGTFNDLTRRCQLVPRKLAIFLGLISAAIRRFLWYPRARSKPHAGPGPRRLSGISMIQDSRRFVGRDRQRGFDWGIQRACNCKPHW
jgi:hypothetical protein